MFAAGQGGREGPRKAAESDCREELDHVAGPTERSPPQIGIVPIPLPERPSSGLAAGKGGGWKWGAQMM